MGFSLAGLTLIGLLGGYVTWIILSIIALANKSNDDIRDKCDNSNIWVCLLILVVIGILSIISGSKSSEDKKTTILPIVLFNIAFIIWVGIELYKPCALNHLSDMNIYIILYAWFWFSICIIGILIIALCCLCTVACEMDNIILKHGNFEQNGGSPSEQVTDNDINENSKGKYKVFNNIIDYINLKHLIKENDDEIV